MAQEMFKKIKIFIKRHNRTSNLLEHIEDFEAALDAYNTTDADKCKGFPIILEGNTGN